jgi:hypothetical protein
MSDLTMNSFVQHSVAERDGITGVQFDVPTNNIKQRNVAPNILIPLLAGFAYKETINMTKVTSLRHTSINESIVQHNYIIYNYLHVDQRAMIRQ